MMETVFYDDYNSTHNSFLSAGMNNLNQLKRKLTLDLNFSASSDGNNGTSKQTSVIKKAKVASLNTPICGGTVLNSPDLHMLKLGSPELERLIIHQTSLLPTPTPTQSQLFFPKNVTEEQELYARGFTEALSKLQSQNESVTNIAPSNNNNPTIITNNSSIVNISTHNNLPSQQLVSTSNPSTHQLTSNSQPIMQLNTNLNQVAHPQHPPPPYYNNLNNDSSDDMSDDSMSENSCSNSTTSSSTYTTNGHVLVPPSSILMMNPNNTQGNHGFPVTSANSMIHHHRLPDYQTNQLGSGGGVASGTATIPVSAASYPHASHSPQLNLIKEEPQTVPSTSATPSVSPIDMASQEKIKLERKRQRNRVAASKCRKRKLERISKLEDKVKLLKNENSDLTNVLTKLKETVCHLKQQVMEHFNSGCQIIVSQSMTTL